ARPTLVRLHSAGQFPSNRVGFRAVGAKAPTRRKGWRRISLPPDGGIPRSLAMLSLSTLHASLHGPRGKPSRFLLRRPLTGLVTIALVLGVAGSARAAPEGQLTWAVHVTLAPTWFDPAETSGIITPYMVLYAIHDAMVKPMPGNSLTPSLAETIAVSDDK